MLLQFKRQVGNFNIGLEKILSFISSMSWVFFLERKELQCSFLPYPYKNSWEVLSFWNSREEAKILKGEDECRIMVVFNTKKYFFKCLQWSLAWKYGGSALHKFTPCERTSWEQKKNRLPESKTSLEWYEHFVWPILELKCLTAVCLV